MNESLPLEKELAGIFKDKLPAFPEEIKELLVKIAPWLALIGAVLGGIGLLFALVGGGFVAVATVGTEAYGSPWGYWVGMLSLALYVVICLIAFTPLRNRQRRGWNLLYYFQLLSLVVNLITLNIIGLLIGGFLGFWILFQIREKYS